MHFFCHQSLIQKTRRTVHERPIGLVKMKVLGAIEAPPEKTRSRKNPSRRHTCRSSTSQGDHHRFHLADHPTCTTAYKKQRLTEHGTLHREPTKASHARSRRRKSFEAINAALPPLRLLQKQAARGRRRKSACLSVLASKRDCCTPARSR